MAVFKATTAFNITTLSLNKLIANQTDSVFYNNINLITGGSTEQDILGYQYNDVTTQSAFLIGRGFALDSKGDVTGGTVSSLLFFNGSLTDFGSPSFSITRLSLSASEVYAATRTATAADDLVVIGKGLAGNDVFQLSAGNDTVNGFGGDDKIEGNGGNDSLSGGAGNDMISGGDGDDILIGGTGNDALRGGAGLDRALYFDATSAVTVDLRITIAQNTGGAGTDTFSSVESVSGSSFNDTINGDTRGNALLGGLGRDTLNGHEGVDRLVGGAGQDTLTGGTAGDSFVFDAPVNTGGAIFDTITDFTKSQGDRINLSKAVFTGLAGAAGSTLTEDAFFASANATAANDTSDRIVYNTATGALYYDADGSGGTAAVQIALLGTTTHPALAFGDILIVA